MKLRRAQLKRLRQAKSRTLLAADINRGSARRTYASLFDLGLIGWDPILQGRVRITAAGEAQLALEMRRT